MPKKRSQNKNLLEKGLGFLVGYKAQSFSFEQFFILGPLLWHLLVENCVEKRIYSLMTPCLNWKELALLTEQIRMSAQDLFVEKLVVPDRSLFPGGYIKGELVIRMTGRKSEGVLLISTRPRHPYIVWAERKSPKSSPQATKSPFFLALSKYLKAAKLLNLEALPKERVVILWFSMEEDSSQMYGLVLVLIPAVPEAFLVSTSKSKQAPWKILARSKSTSEVLKEFIPPSGINAPEAPKIREELCTPKGLYEAIEKELLKEAFEQRLQLALKNIKQLSKQAQDRLRQSETALTEAQKEPDWQKYGDLLKASLGGEPPFLENGKIKVYDYEAESEIWIPCDLPKLSLKEQTEKYYQNARRKKRRIEEARMRAETFREKLQVLEKLTKNHPESGDWKNLEILERSSESRTGGPSMSKPGAKKGFSWLGKTFISRDGLAIFAGRNKDENLELTFKHARGNDLWMHVRGRPGAHIVVPLQPGKSAPLETLLDAAQLAIHYSGGSNWGKTEIDYTFKKYVKRIKNSTEASYTQNKTLLVEPDAARLKRLLDQQA